MKRIGVIANPKRPHAADIFERLETKARALGLTLFADANSAAHLPSAAVLDFADFAQTVDAVLAMGGDGTVLFAASVLAGADVPVLGINLGSLGFLTGVGEDELDPALDALAAGACIRDARAVAECTLLRQGRADGTYRVLNDAVVGFGGSSHIVTLDMSINGEPITSFACDGMIVTTPTGSTGHSLAAGGPILQPGSGAFGISVICPHTLSNRPLIIPDSSLIEIAVRRSRKALVFSADGQDAGELREGDAVRIVRSDRPVTFLHLPGYSYFSVLSRKLHWRGSNF